MVAASRRTMFSSRRIFGRSDLSKYWMLIFFLTLSTPLLSLHLTKPELFHITGSIEDPYGEIKNLGMQLFCDMEKISITISTPTGFYGLIYPKDAFRKCAQRYHTTSNRINFNIPLNDCDTQRVSEPNGVSFYNSLVVQPHRRVLTARGRSFVVRCTYTVRNKSSAVGVRVNDLPVVSHHRTASPPSVQMKMFHGNDTKYEVIDSVKLGESLTLVMRIRKQDMYGLKITNCSVRNTMEGYEMVLIDLYGCPVDEHVMGVFKYANGGTTAFVHFRAFRFPTHANIQYHCSAKVCLKTLGDCGDDWTPVCPNHAVSKRSLIQETFSKDDEEDVFQQVDTYLTIYVV